jgi:hypothetical protein
MNQYRLVIDHLLWKTSLPTSLYLSLAPPLCVCLSIQLSSHSLGILPGSLLQQHYQLAVTEDNSIVCLCM